MRISIQPAVISAPRGRKGFSMTEMAAVMFVLAIALMLGAVLLAGAFRIRSAAAASDRRVTLRSELADQFRADVGQAVAGPERLDKFTASPSCLILRRIDGKEIIYRLEDADVERTELAGGRQSRRHLQPGTEQTTMEFHRSGPDQRMVTLRLNESRGPSRPNRQVDISAALGGDVR